MRILIVGYYNHCNFGDDLYQEAFPCVLSGHFLTFTDIEKVHHHNAEEYDVVILGGGDVVSEYFLDKFSKWYFKQSVHIPCYAYSIGIPYYSLVEEGKIDLFDHIICRNQIDIQPLSKRFGKENVSYLPDFVFSIPTNFKLKNLPTQNRRKVSICLAQPSFQKPELFNQLVTYLSHLAVDYHLVYLPFNFNLRNSKENDYHLGLRLKEHIPELEVYDQKLDFETTISHLNTSYFSVCMRLHSHILSIIACCPFISIHSTRKVRNLLNDFNLVELGTPINLKCKYCNQTTKPSLDPHIREITGCKSCHEMCGVPTSLDLEELERIEKYVVKNREMIRQELEVISYRNYQLLTDCPIIPLGKRRETPPFYSNPLVIDTQIREIIGLLLDNLYQITCEQSTTDRKEDDLTYLRENSVLDLLKLLNISSKSFNQVASDLVDIICYKITRHTHPDFRWGLREKILLPNYNIYESLDYLLKNHSPDLSKISKIINPKGKFNLFKIYQEQLINFHYSGWAYATNIIFQNLHNPKGILFNGFLDKTFHWEYNFNLKCGMIPYQEPWVGFLHHGLDEDYSIYNCQELFKKQAFLDSLQTCKGIYVLSRYLRIWLQKKIAQLGYDVQVENLNHPTEIPVNKFVINKFILNPVKRIIHIGGWYRNPYAIYQLTTNLKKSIMKGKSMDNYFKPEDFSFDDILSYRNWQTGDNDGCCRNEQCERNEHSGEGGGCCRDGITNVTNNCSCRDEHCERNEHSGEGCECCRVEKTRNKYLIGMVKMLEENHQSVEVLENIDNCYYDHLLSQNIVFLNLTDCSASNTVIECIVRNTPILINPLPAVVEVLGKSYPFYYRTMEEACEKSNDLTLIKLTHYYLRSMSKERFTGTYFLRSIQESDIYQNIDL